MALSTARFFLGFLPIVFLIYCAFPKSKRWLVLLSASYVFAWMASGSLALFMVATTVVVYVGARALGALNQQAQRQADGETREERKARKEKLNKRKRIVVSVCVLAALGILIGLKYGAFLGGMLDALRAALSLPSLFGTASSVALPLGISFYTLMAISYLVDVYRGKYPACKNFGTVALYVSFFPQLNEGPFGRFDAMGRQLRAGLVAHGPQLAYAVQLIAWGLFKKLVVADRLNPLVGELFTNHASYSGVMVALAAVLYTIQLYADFSGVIDIARGSAQLFGVSLESNFRQPFFSASVNEFWRRWHITLGSWLRDYVFYPVSLSRPVKKIARWSRKRLPKHAAVLLTSLFSLLAVWLTCGIWHGAAWKYVAYGLYYFAIVFAGMLFEPLFKRFFSRTGIDRAGKGFHRFAVARTCVLVCVGMLMFRADNLSVFASMMASLFTGPGIEPLLNGSWLSHGTDALDLGVVAVSVAIMFFVGRSRERGTSFRAVMSERGFWRSCAVFCALCCATLVFGAYGAGYVAVPSIYAGF